MQQNKSYIEIDFYKLWRHVRLTRLQKENIKNILFTPFPFLFQQFAAYQNWKNAQVFAVNRKDNTQQTPENSTIVNYRNNNHHNIVKPINKLAVVIHVFYLDVFFEILTMLSSTSHPKLKLYITCPECLNTEIKETLEKMAFSFKIKTVKNHGRDILPFLKILPIVFKENYELVLKIHTKRSNHLNKKELWQTDLFSKLLVHENIINIVNVFEKYPQIGMLGPSGNILPMSLYYGGNAHTVEKLCLNMGLEHHQLHNLNFVAGSMFYARKEALLPVLNLGLNDENFEKEDKQLDNTMAHAVERAFAGGLIVTGLKLVDSSSSPKNISYRITKNHPFTI